MIGILDTGPLWTLTLRRPEKANSLTRTMLESLARTVQRASREGARALILTGEGKVFSAGADLDEARAGLATATVFRSRRGPIWMRRGPVWQPRPFGKSCQVPSPPFRA